MKKFFSVVLSILLLSCNIAFCAEINNKEIENSNTQKISQENSDINVETFDEETTKKISASVEENKIKSLNHISNVSFFGIKQLNKKEYKRSTIFKYFTPYQVILVNNNDEPIIMTTNTEVDFVKTDGSVIKSSTRRDIYMRTRKRDRGRHYALAVPGIILGSAVSVGTFLLGTPIGYGIYKAFQYPVIKAARGNVNISQDLYSQHGIPLRFETGIEYTLYFYPPKETEIKSIIIKNVSLNNTTGIIEIPLSEVL